MILAIGGAPEFNDSEQATKEIEVVLRYLNIKPKDVKLIYGFGDEKKAAAGEGGHFFARQWAESNDVIYRDGNPKWDEHGKNAVGKRNTILSECCDAMVLFIKGNSTGGNSIVDAFASNLVPIFRIEQNVIKKNPEDARKVYSQIAKGLLENSVTLDVETTGLDEVNDDVIEIAVIDSKTNKPIYDSFIYTETPVGEKAFLVNNITKEMLEGKPVLSEAYKSIAPKIKGKIIVASNSKFDEKMVCFGLVKQGATPPNNLWTCLQELYSKYSCQPRKGLNTARIAQQLGIEPGTHRALADAEAQAKILRAMADGVVPDLTV